MEKLIEKAKAKEAGATEEIIEKFKYLIFLDYVITKSIV